MGFPGQECDGGDQSPAGGLAQIEHPLEPLRAAVASLAPRDAALICCEQVYPLHRDMEGLLAKTERRIFVEGNATGQFARLVRTETGHSATDTVLKHDGQPFSVEELTERLSALLGRAADEDAGR